MRVVRLPAGLALYRGLGGSMALPESFYTADENGCKGYTEWGFLSTTSNRAIAVEVLPAVAYGGVVPDAHLASSSIVSSVLCCAVKLGACHIRHLHATIIYAPSCAVLLPTAVMSLACILFLCFGIRRFARRPEQCGTNHLVYTWVC